MSPGTGRPRRTPADGELILVSIAAYRDPELGPTIEDCLHRAEFPGRLRFVVCWQHGEGDQPPECFEDRRVRVIDVPWKESRGVCWARAEIMKLWDGEEWYLQLDSHHRFARGWDCELIDQARNTGASNPVITTYAPPYVPGEVPVFEEPMRIEFSKFEDGIAVFRPGHFADWRERTVPIRGRFASAHLFFAPGTFTYQVPYDPELYFTGEEITLAVRAFTHGYDLFEPSRLIAWHEYSRAYRRKHWDDHQARNGVAVAWYERDAMSRERVRRMFREPWFGPFGCGRVRTLADYEAYAGLSFQHRRVLDSTRQNLEPPCPLPDDDWTQRPSQWRVHILLSLSNLPSSAVDDPQFWYVGFHGGDGRELFRQDADLNELRDLLATRQSTITLTRTFESIAEPATWTVMPYTKRDGWLNSITGSVANGHVAVAERSNGERSPVVSC
jgi:Glycosyltransferase (GlcNAc)